MIKFAYIDMYFIKLHPFIAVKTKPFILKS